MDGSVTIHLPEMKESYHSKFGAIQEANHVFIKNGLDLFEGRPVSILEIGFGTGLNAFITLLETQKNKQTVNYTGVEAYPVEMNEISQLNYVSQLDAVVHSDKFELMHCADWEKEINIVPGFTLTKRRQFFHTIEDTNAFDLIYFDAFGYHAQPELWSAEIFARMFGALRQKGVLVTYACRTNIKNAMREAGFTTEKLPGPPGKREMLRAFKD